MNLKDKLEELKEKGLEEIKNADTNTYIDFARFLDTFRNSKKIIILNLLLGYELLTDKTAFDIAKAIKSKYYK